MQKEAIYVFNYKGQTVEIHASVDPIEKRRYWDTTGGKSPMQYALNYVGTGVTETQIITPEIVHEEPVPDFASYQRNMSVILFKLPDVDAYAVGYYSELFEGDSGNPSPSLTITLLDKI